MSLDTNIKNLVTAIATEIKTVRSEVSATTGSLGDLTTTAKSNLVAALNELHGLIGGAGATINDGTASSSTVYSSTKVESLVSTAISNLVDSSPAALDTLNELAAALNDDPNFASTVTSALGNRVRTDTATQGLDATQQANARANIGAQAAADIGSTSTNFVTLFEAGLV